VATPGSSPTTTAPTRTNTGIGRCGPGYERTVAFTGYSGITDKLDGFALTSNEATVRRGENISFTLVNRADEERETGNRSKYDIQRHTNDSWQSVFWKQTDPHPFYHSDLILHPPGEGFAWEFTLTSEALSHEIENGTGHLAVCDPLQPGTYRFVFHGNPSNDQDTALGCRFDVVEG
jgi:hypothetical protein